MGMFWVVMGGSGFNLGIDRWWWVYFGWWWRGVSFILSCGGFILGDGGR